MKTGILTILLLSTWLCATAAEFDLKNQRVVLAAEDRGKVVTTPADMVLASIFPPSGEVIERIFAGSMKCDAPKCRVEISVFTNKSHKYSIVATVALGPIEFNLAE